jgi:hypothetical protein
MPFESWMNFEEAKRSRSEKDSVPMKKIVLLPVRLLLNIQGIQGLHLPVLVPRGAMWPRPVLNRNLPEGSLLSAVSSPPIPFSRVQLLIYVNIPLYPSKLMYQGSALSHGFGQITSRVVYVSL